MNSTLFLIVRVAHVTAAAIYLGSHIFSTLTRGAFAPVGRMIVDSSSPRRWTCP